MEEFDYKIKLRGTVINVTYHNDMNDYTVFTIDTGDEELTVVGTATGIHDGDKVEVLGDYTYHSTYGRQFKAQICTALLPETVDDLYRYLASGVIKGVREATARKIVERFGEMTFDILDNDPLRLSEIKGITKQKAKQIGDNYKKQCSTRALIMRLSRYGFKTNECILAYEKLGNNAVEIIEENPYVLCEGEKRIDFERVEQIAENLPNKPSNSFRIEAGIIYVLTHNLYNGHTCVPLKKLFKPSDSLLGISQDEFLIAIDNLVESKKIVIEEISNEEFVFLHNAYNAEKHIAERLSVLLKFPPENPINVNDYIEQIEKCNDIKYAEMQINAIKTAVNRGILVLTGGPGTGKTTTLNGIIHMYEKENLRIALCAPTGRASQRITETTNRDASTIHRLLEVEWDSHDKPKFKRNLRNPLEYDAIIIDEMSMTDIFLFENLLNALPFGCRLIMVGDSNQLPSVGAGNVLKDIIDSELLPVVELTEIFRQAMKSNIVMNAHKIVNGDHIDETYSSGDFFIVERYNSLDSAYTVRDLYTRRLPNTYSLDSLKQIQVLCPSRMGDTGTENLNIILQEALNPPQQDKMQCQIGHKIFRVGDKIMQTKNNYNIHWESEYDEGDGIYNGDIGFIKSIQLNNDAIVIDFQGKITTYSMEQLREIELAYAITVHKSQGSEFDAVIMPIIGVNSKLCYRNLLYTAVTRAKKLMVVVGNQNSINSMIDNNKIQLRYSGLRHFLLHKN